MNTSLLIISIHKSIHPSVCLYVYLPVYITRFFLLSILLINYIHLPAYASNYPRTLQRSMLTHFLYCRWGAKVNNNKCRFRFVYTELRGGITADTQIEFRVLIYPHWGTDASTIILANILISIFLYTSNIFIKGGVQKDSLSHFCCIYICV